MQIPDDADHQDPAPVPDPDPDPGQEGNQADRPRPSPPPPGYVRCPMLGCGRLHELPPDFW